MNKIVKKTKINLKTKMRDASENVGNKGEYKKKAADKKPI